MPGPHMSKQKRQAKHVADSERRRGKDTKVAERIGWATTNARKGIQLMTIDECFESISKGPGERVAYHAGAAQRIAPDPSRTAHVNQPPPVVPDIADRRSVKKFPRKMKPTVKMKPISNEEAMAHIRSGTYSANKQKSLKWLTALKALATGYGKTSGGGALKAPNRSGSVDLDMGNKPGAVTTTSKALTEKRLLVSNTNFNDIFKSELGTPADEVLCKCPHCEAPITKSDLAKGHGGKGKVTHISGPKHGKSGAHVAEQDPEGGTMRGGSGRGVHTSSRGVPGAKKHDEPTGVQNSKGSRTRKGGNDDDSSSDVGSDDVGKSVDAELGDVDKSDHGFKQGKSVVHNPSAGKNVTGTPGKVQAASSGAVKKSISIRGTEYVQWVDDGSDAQLAKSIADGSLGGTPPTQPLDMNNDLTRLLV